MDVAIESVKQIEAAEKEAENIINRAVIEKEKIIGDALKAGENLIHEKRMQVKKEKETLFDKARKSAEEEIARLSSENKQQIQQLDDSRKLMDKAVNFIVEQITK